jgi:hypothetical protein
MTSLVQSRRGRGYAIAALGALAIGSFNHTTADPASGSRSRAEAPQEQEPPASHDVFVNELSVGDCLPRTPRRGVREVQLAQGTLPRRQESPTASRQRVPPAVRAVVGASFEISELDMYYLTPVREFWPGDRAVLCAVAMTAPTTGTVKGSQR